MKKKVFWILVLIIFGAITIYLLKAPSNEKPSAALSSENAKKAEVESVDSSGQSFPATSSEGAQSQASRTPAHIPKLLKHKEVEWRLSSDAPRFVVYEAFLDGVMIIGHQKRMRKVDDGTLAHISETLPADVGAQKRYPEIDGVSFAREIKGTFDLSHSKFLRKAWAETFDGLQPIVEIEVKNPQKEGRPEIWRVHADSKQVLRELPRGRN